MRHHRMSWRVVGLRLIAGATALSDGAVEHRIVFTIKDGHNPRDPVSGGGLLSLAGQRCWPRKACAIASARSWRPGFGPSDRVTTGHTVCSRPAVHPSIFKE